MKIGSIGLTANSTLCGHGWLRIALQLWHRLSDHSHTGSYDQHTPMSSQRRHCCDPLVFFEEPGPSSITKATEDSKYEDGVDDFV